MLSTELLSKLSFKSVGEYNIAYQSSMVNIDYEVANLPFLIPPNEQELLDYNQGHNPSYLGDFKIAKLQKILHQAGIQADFVGGVLVCANGKVNIRKATKDKISIQGALSKVYYQIRNLLYNEFEIV